MSYCRFSDADAYIYDHVYFGLFCQVCHLMPTETSYSVVFEMDMTYHQDFVAGYDYDKMLAHVAEHRAAGDYIPEDVDERLRFERDCNHDYKSDGYCKHCWRKQDGQDLG